MDQNAKTVIVRILDKEFRLACKPEAASALKEAGLYLDTRMRRIRQQGRVIGMDRIAVMAALSITNELLELQRNPQMEEVGITDRLQTMQEKIDTALAQAEQQHEKRRDADHTAQATDTVSNALETEF